MSVGRFQHPSLAVALRLVAVLLLACAAFVPLSTNAQPDLPTEPLVQSKTGVYIVQMADLPVVSYEGGIPGLRGTRPAEGQQADKQDPGVQDYVAYLDGRHDDALSAVGGAEKLYDYRFTYNGFAAKLTPEQAQQIQNVPGVVAVTPDEIQQADTITTPTFLGLTQPGGLWSQLGGPNLAGEGIIVGIIDSGIWPENGSFADNGSYKALPRWKGTCVTGEEWTTANCNKKLIGARYFNAGYGGDAGINATRPWEFNSPRDYNGHGSHTSSTAAGNYNVPASADGTSFGKVSGMAPRARIAVYKALWSTQDGSTASGTTSDLVAAIDAAVADGVNVINYSISGSTTSVTDPAEQAFLNAAGAGVFVAASAGNSGPTASTVAHNSPWVMTVAASSHDRGYSSSVTLGDGGVYQGVSLGSGTAMLPLIKSTAAGLPGADATQVRLCFSGTLDPAVVAGKIVQCDRGTNARVDKSLAVQMAGGLGMILTNTSANSLNADIHYVPSIHTDEVAGAAIKAYIDAAGAGATAQIAPGQLVTVEAPVTASFSSRGPARAISGNLLKPDITAPGVDVLAAVAPTINGRNYDFYSGTSMSSPHVAGLAALLKQAHPNWTPAMIKSALMTTASQVTNWGNPIAGNPFGFGAGHVSPTAANDPGLVYNAMPKDYAAFLCGQGLVNDARCLLGAISASDLNLPSIAVGSLAGSQTVKRTVTNVGMAAATYNVAISVPGFTATVTPASLTLASGQSKSFTVTFTRTTAALNAYAFGAMTWSDGKHKVRSPIALRPVAIAAPAAVSGAGASGSTSYNVTFGYDGAFAALPHGLVPATTFSSSVMTDQYVDFAVVIPAGTKLARFSLFNAYTNPASDLDLEIYRGSTLVGSSGGGTSDEEVNLTNPTAATYTARVVGFATADPTTFTLFAWAITAADAGNMTVTAPSTAAIGAQGAITLNWSGLTPATKYLGQVTYHNVAAPASYDDGRIGITVVSVDVP